MAFLNRCTITVQSGQVPSTQSDFPVLIYKVSNALKFGHGGSVKNVDGNDVRVFSDSGCTSAIPFQKRYYNGTIGLFIAVAKISSLADASVYYLGIGDVSLTTDASTTAVWSTSFDQLVVTTGDGVTLDLVDHSPKGINAINGTLTQATTPAAGQILGSADFERANGDYMVAGSSVNYSLGTLSFTAMAWVKIKSTGIFGGIIGVIDGADAAGWTLYINNTNHFEAFQVRTGGYTVVTSSSTFTSTTTWYQVVLVRLSTGVMNLYVNGVLEGTVSGTVRDVDNASAGMAMGAVRGDLLANFANAYESDFRLGLFGADADFVTTLLNTEKDPAAFASYVFDSEPSGSSVIPVLMNSYRQRRSA